MHPRDPMVVRQIPMILEIIHNETWYEGERRGCPVSKDDPVVRAKVAEVVLREGARMRVVCTSPPPEPAPTNKD
ncbi:MAG: hypothetical protein RLZZ15_2106 [Verrucomicrobiota bacterium]|jgi:hypothetical protein